MKIVQFQDSTGYFSGLPDKYSHLLSEEIPQSIRDVISDEDDLKKAWTTILAICILQKHYKETKGEWTMMVKKAEAFLKSKHLKTYRDEIKKTMELV